MLILQALEHVRSRVGHRLSVLSTRDVIIMPTQVDGSPFIMCARLCDTGHSATEILSSCQ